MDGRRFDDLARVVAHPSNRRRFIRPIFGGLVGAALLTLGIAGDTEAGRCKNDGDCPGCKTCDRKKKKCVKGCPKGKKCCGGDCVRSDLCCATAAECKACATCVDGRCQPNAAKNGQQCSGCLTYNNGACGSGDDELCAGNERCRQSTGLCCPKCRADGNCCPVGQACINPGLLSANSCCDSSANTPCGENGDGTFSECCANFNERCVGGECVPKVDCPNRRLSAAGVCCPNGPACGGVCCGDGEACCLGVCQGEDAPCCGAGGTFCPGLTRPYCAPPGQVCCGDYTCGLEEDCCEPQGNVCCAEGRCVGSACCPPDVVICGNSCCEFGEICCGNVCCTEYNCLNGTCCAAGVCGDVGASTRVCPVPGQICCLTDDANPAIGNRGYTCPNSTPVCSNKGECCPESTRYSQSCGGCCPDQGCANCTSPIPGGS